MPSTMDSRTPIHPVAPARAPGRRTAAPVALAVALSLSAACGVDATPTEDGAAADADAPQAVTIRFAARVGDRPLDCASRYEGLGAPGVVASLRDLRVFVHDVRLVDASGAEVPLALEQDGVNQVEGVALLDFEDGTGSCERGTPEVRDVVTGTAPPGDYQGLRFRVGVPQELNHIDVTGAPPPLDTSALFWGWSDGRIFLTASLSSNDEDDEGDRVFQVQLASSGCVGDPRVGDVVSCDHQNRGAVELASFDPEADVVVADLGALLEGVDLRVAPSCHADAEEASCQQVFARIGVALDSGGPSPETQAFFRAERP
jgi:uncharacterized repeat protein (TIGR04052 family)